MSRKNRTTINFQAMQRDPALATKFGFKTTDPSHGLRESGNDPTLEESLAELYRKAKEREIITQEYVAYCDRHLPNPIPSNPSLSNPSLPNTSSATTHQHFLSEKVYETLTARDDAILHLSPYITNYLGCPHAYQVLKNSAAERKVIAASMAQPSVISAPLGATGCHFCWRILSQPQNIELYGKFDKRVSSTFLQERRAQYDMRERVMCLIDRYVMWQHNIGAPLTEESLRHRYEMYHFMYYGRTVLSFHDFSAIRNGEKTFAEVQATKKNTPLYQI